MIKRLLTPLVVLALVVLALTLPFSNTVHGQPVLGRVNCIVLSTTIVSTLVTGCEAPTGVNAIYIRSIQWYSSIVATTSAWMVIQDGTGGSCGTATTVRYNGYNALAFGGDSVVFNEPVKVDVASELCFVYAAAGTRLVSIQGYVGP